MNTILATLFVLLSSALSVYAQGRTFAESTYALKGRVRTVRVERAKFVEKDGSYIEGPRVLSMTIAFNEDINRTEVCFHDEKGALTRRIVDKYDGKRATEFLNYDGQGKMWLRGVFLYDDQGQPAGRESYNGDGTLRTRSTLKRNNRGQVIESAEFDARGALLSKLTNAYTEKGELTIIEHATYGPNGALRSRVVHDLLSRRSETANYNDDGTVAGNSVRSNQQITNYGPDGSLTRTAVVSDPGRLSEETKYSPDGSVVNQSPLPDQVDAQGNWVKLTEWVSDAKGRRPVKVSYRLITYY